MVVEPAFGHAATDAYNHEFCLEKIAKIIQDFDLKAKQPLRFFLFKFYLNFCCPVVKTLGQMSHFLYGCLNLISNLIKPFTL